MNQTFKDSQDRTWEVNLDGPKIKAVRSELGVDLLSATIFEQLESDTVLLVDVIYLLCKSQADGQTVSATQFGESLVGDPIDEATESLINAIVAFSPARKRSLLRNLAQKNREQMEAAEEAVMDKMQDPNLMKRFREALDKKMEADLSDLLNRYGSASNSQDS